MLDALVGEARDRWGLDVSAGIQVVAAERLPATPIEASRPLLVVPVAILRGAADEAAGPPGVALPGRHGPGGADPLRVLSRLYPGDATVVRLGAPPGRGGDTDRTTIAALTAEDLA